MPGPVSQLAGSCASFHRKWTLKLARAVAARFVAAVPRYLSRKGLEAFAATTFDGRSGLTPLQDFVDMPPLAGGYRV